MRNFRLISLPIAVVALALTGTGANAQGSLSAPKPQAKVVIKWNENAHAVLKELHPYEQVRWITMVHAAMHDAVNTVTPKYKTFATVTADAAGAREPFAAAVAAYAVLAAARPGQGGRARRDAQGRSRGGGRRQAGREVKGGRRGRGQGDHRSPQGRSLRGQGRVEGAARLGRGEVRADRGKYRPSLPAVSEGEALGPQVRRPVSGAAAPRWTARSRWSPTSR